MYDAIVTRCQAMWTGICAMRAISCDAFRFCLVHNFQELESFVGESSCFDDFVMSKCPDAGGWQL